MAVSSSRRHHQYEIQTVLSSQKGDGGDIPTRVILWTFLYWKTQWKDLEWKQVITKSPDFFVPQPMEGRKGL